MTAVRREYEEVETENAHIGVRALRDVVTDLETMGLPDTWIQSRGAE